MRTGTSLAWRWNLAALRPGLGETFTSCLTIEYLSTYLWSLQWLLMRSRCYSDTYAVIWNCSCNFGNGSTLFELNELSWFNYPKFGIVWAHASNALENDSFYRVYKKCYYFNRMSSPEILTETIWIWTWCLKHLSILVDKMASQKLQWFSRPEEKLKIALFLYENR